MFVVHTSGGWHPGSARQHLGITFRGRDVRDSVYKGCREIVLRYNLSRNKAQSIKSHQPLWETEELGEGTQVRVVDSCRANARQGQRETVHIKENVAPHDDHHVKCLPHALADLAPVDPFEVCI